MVAKVFKAAWRKRATRRAAYAFEFRFDSKIGKGGRELIRSGRCHWRQNASLGSTSLSI